MHEIEELQRRITAALDRIGTGVEAVEAPAGASGTGAEAGDLETALEDERRAAAQLRDRLEAMKASHDRELDEARSALEQAKALLSEVEEDRNRLKAANEALGEAARSLRDATGDGVSDADLVNNAALAELDALKTMRASDRAELDALMRLLAPTIDAEGEVTNA